MRYLEPRPFYDIALVSAPSEHFPAVYCEATLTAQLIDSYSQIVKLEHRYITAKDTAIRSESLKRAHGWLRYLRAHYQSVMIAQRCETCSSLITQTLQPCPLSDIEACMPYIYSS